MVVPRASPAWLPGVAAFWASLRVYFAVSHASVAGKLRAVLFPFAKKQWRRKRAEELDGGGDARAGALHGHALPLEDDNAPDGYVPLVAFVTFALVAGYVRGSRGTFTPEVLASIFSWCAGLQMLEIALYSLGLYLLGAHNVPVLDVACFTGYKYGALSINAIAHFFGGERAYYAALFWTGLSASYFMLKTMAQAVPAELESAAAARSARSGPRKKAPKKDATEAEAPPPPVAEAPGGTTSVAFDSAKALGPESAARDVAPGSVLVAINGEPLELPEVCLGEDHLSLARKKVIAAKGEGSTVILDFQDA
ncbi:hypothetical protein JL720_5582 [Aureococcus anophagefferens]|nr:hypothetical protein JL720_5582 [Aureococcus anophagefferens]